jgi:two-component system sensor histidine kinase BarA
VLACPFNNFCWQFINKIPVDSRESCVSLGTLNLNLHSRETYMTGPIQKPRFREQLKFRLSLGLAIVIFAVVLTITGLLSWFGSQRELAQQHALLQNTSKVFATSIAESLARDDKRKVQLVLTAIGKIPQFRFARVNGKNSTPYAEMGFGTHLSSQSGLEDLGDFSLLTTDRIWISSNIRYAGEALGSLRILADISQIRQEFLFNILINILVALVSAILAILVSISVISKITRPINRLSRLMIGMGDEPDYSTRFHEKQSGEIAVLSKSFNQMLGAIESRDNQIQEYHNTLEERIRQRTHDLEVAKNDAEEANAAKSIFLATVSHEIRTPMNGMMLMSELLASADLSPKYKRYANVITKSGKSLLAIINDILDLSKIQSGKLELEQVNISLEELVYDSMSLFTQMASDKGLELNCLINPDVPLAFTGDPTRINQVLGNLINNALKFTSNGSVTIFVSVEDHDEANHIRFTVADTGIGIKPDKIDHVFETYSQAESSTTRNYGGTGLGLSICKQLTHLMEGDITATSEYGKGSRFSFSLPLIDAGEIYEYETINDYNALILMEPSMSVELIADVLNTSGTSVLKAPPQTMSSIDLSQYQLVVAEFDTFKKYQQIAEIQHSIALVELGMESEEENAGLDKISDILEKPLSSISFARSFDRVFNNRGSSAGLKLKSDRNENEIADYSGKSVLVADDNEVNREVISQALERFNIIPLIVENGKQAVEAFKPGAFDIVLMDCNMPVMDGFDASKAMREHEELRQAEPVPIVALTGHRPDQIKDKMQACGMNDVVVKPYTIKAIGACLGKYLAKTETGTTDEAIIDEIPVAQSAPADEPSINDELLEDLKELAGDSFEETITRLRTIFMDTAPEIFSQLETAVTGKNAHEIAQTTHALSSMSSNIAAGKLAELTKELENHVLADQSSKIDELFYLINCEYRQVIEILQSETTEPVENTENTALA